MRAAERLSISMAGLLNTKPRRDPVAWPNGQGRRITTDIADALAARYWRPLPALLNDTMRKLN